MIRPLLLLFLFVTPSLASAQEAPRTSSIWALEGDGWKHARHAGTIVLTGRLTLPRGSVRGTCVVSLPVERFDSLLLSLNPEPLPVGSRVTTAVRLQLKDERWTGWLALGDYGNPELRSAKPSFAG